MTERAEIVVILAKEPKPGRVKTRLQSRFTADEAAQLAAAALRDTQRAYAPHASPTNSVLGRGSVGFRRRLRRRTAAHRHPQRPAWPAPSMILVNSACASADRHGYAADQRRAARCDWEDCDAVIGSARTAGSGRSAFGGRRQSFCRDRDVDRTYRLGPAGPPAEPGAIGEAAAAAARHRRAVGRRVRRRSLSRLGVLAALCRAHPHLDQSRSSTTYTPESGTQRRPGRTCAPTRGNALVGSSRRRRPVSGVAMPRAGARSRLRSWADGAGPGRIGCTGSGSTCPP